MAAMWFYLPKTRYKLCHFHWQTFECTFFHTRVNMFSYDCITHWTPAFQITFEYHSISWFFLTSWEMMGKKSKLSSANRLENIESLRLWTNSFVLDGYIATRASEFFCFLEVFQPGTLHAYCLFEVLFIFFVNVQYCKTLHRH